MAKSRNKNDSIECMEKLSQLLIENQSFLSKCQARAVYCRKSISSVESDFHKQYGSFSSYWDDWLEEVEEIKFDLEDSISNTTLFLSELKDYINNYTDKKRHTKSDKEYHLEVIALTQGKLIEQQALVKDVDFRINLHKQMTEKLTQVERIEELNDD